MSFGSGSRQRRPRLRVVRLRRLLSRSCRSIGIRGMAIAMIRRVRLGIPISLGIQKIFGIIDCFR